MTAAGLLAGRHALVTGAARGIGLATARRFLEEGANVVLCDALAADVEAAAAELGAVAVPFDVADEHAVEAGVAEAERLLGGLDVLVANAGILRQGPLLDQPLAEVRETLDVNLLGVLNCFRAAGSRFRDRGGGVLLATASQAGLHGYPGLGAYCASKFGVIALVETLAKELGPYGVRVNAVAPGLIETAMHRAHMAGIAERAGRDAEDVRRRLVAGVPLGRPGEPAEVADAFVYLASGLASYVSGATIHIEGGECT